MSCDNPAYCGQSANQGKLEPGSIFENEGFAILKCGGY